ncbi:MAG: UTP--glucose-1-phosphate uridylyltransferase GalU [Bdellovibrionota bacterium]
MIKKAVIPAAGFGTRFLPATKAQPKEMLTVVDKPTIQYVVEEAVEAGIEQILIITGRNKQSIENHFDRSFELECELQKKGKLKLYDEMLKISDMAEIFYVRQKELNGLGGAIKYAKHFINDEPFAILLGDTIVKGKECCTKELIKTYEKYNKSVISIEEVAKENVNLYGIIDGTKIEDEIYKVNNLIEKPSIEEAPSNLAIAGRYLLTPDIFEYLEKIEVSKNGEYQLTCALKLLCNEKGGVARKYDGKRYDIGNKLGYLITTIELATQREDLGDDFKAYLKEYVKNL